MKKESIFNDEVSLFNSIYIIQKGFEKFLKDNVNDLNINKAESKFLGEIYYNEGISQREIARNLFVSEANIAKTYKILESKGFIYKKVDEKNNTRRQLYLTEKGKDSFEEIIKLYEEHHHFILSDYTEEEIRRHEEMMKGIADKSLNFLK